MPPFYERYVAIGDSTTEGLDDPYPDGTPRGWADRLAERLEATAPGLGYATHFGKRPVTVWNEIYD